MTELSSRSSPEEPDVEFLSCLRAALRDGTFIKVSLGSHRGDPLDLKRVSVRRVGLRADDVLSFRYRFSTRDVTENRAIEAGIAEVGSLLGSSFRSAHLFTRDATFQLDFSRKGRAMLSRTKPVGEGGPLTTTHDRQKERLIDASAPFLEGLGIGDGQGKILPSMSRKWKQINKFLEELSHALKRTSLVPESRMRVVDFGAGKGYLTFAVHDYLTRMGHPSVDVLGIEIREGLVDFCNSIAVDHKMDGLRFERGDLLSYAPGKMDVLIALHACDTATDQAIYLGIQSDAALIMCAPCCHKEVRPQMTLPPQLATVLRFGAHLGQEADMVTDSLRALLLELHGYDARIFEFVSLEHTNKNRMLLGVKHTRSVEREKIRCQIADLKSFYGIEEQSLETLLASSIVPDATPS